MLHAARHDGCAGGGQQPLAAARRPQLGGALERPRRGRRAAARAGAVGGPLQLRGGLLVGRDGGRRAVPGAPVVVEHGGQRLVHGAALARRGGAVDGRADQRMAEAQPLAVRVDQPRALGVVERVARQAEPLGGGQHRAELGALVGRGEHEQPLRRPRAAGGSGRGRRPRSRRSAARRRAAARGRARWSSDSARGSSISASGLPWVTLHELVAHASPACARRAARRRASGASPVSASSGSPSRRPSSRDADDQRDRVGVQAAGGEHQRVGRRAGRASARRRPRTAAARPRRPR